MADDGAGRTHPHRSGVFSDGNAARYDEIHSKREWILAPRGLIKDRGGAPLALNAPGKKENEFSRLYPQGEAFSSILGFIGRIDAHQLGQNQHYLPFDLVGKVGVEEAYEEFLRGAHGSVERPVSVDAPGYENPLVTPAKPGDNVSLTIDGTMQRKLFEIVAAYVKKFDTPGGAAVVMDVKSGALRAMVSYPSFDNAAITGELLSDPRRPLFNRATAGTYPLGSTIKPFIAANALAEGIIKPETIIHDQGKIEARSVYDPNVVWTFHGWKPLGNVDMRRAIAMSSNIYFFTVGGGAGDTKGLGIQKLNDGLRLFGFAQKPGLDIGPQEAGFLPLPEWKKETLGEDWFIGDTYNTSIGQGFVRATPLQLAVATSAIANNGIVYKPYLVDHITDQNGSPVFSQKPQIVRKDFLPPWTLQVAREGMRQAITDGTMWRLKDLPFAVAGKTGTAQAGQRKPNHGWVTIFFPYDNPRYVLTILIENGQGGEQSAVPAAKEFLEWYYNNETLNSKF